MSIKTQASETLRTKAGDSYTVYRIGALDDAGLADTSALPCTIKILLEGCLRQWDGEVFGDAQIEALARWGKGADPGIEIPFKPGRVLLQDLTGVPALVDLAALRSAVVGMGG